jgi:hypothetical protein
MGYPSFCFSDKINLVFIEIDAVREYDIRAKQPYVAQPFHRAFPVIL